MIVKHILYGMKLWALQLIPTLFPFMIITKLFLWFENKYSNRTRIVPFQHILCKIWALSPHGLSILFLGQLCGYPAGAQMIKEKFSAHKITKQESNYLMTLCNQSSPAFIISYFISYALDLTNHTMILVFIIYGSTFLTSLITRILYNPSYSKSSEPISKIRPERSQQHPMSFFEALDDSITSSASVCIKIAGYIIFFSGLTALSIELLKFFVPKYLWLSSLCELTYGLSLLKNYDFSSKYLQNLCLFGCFSFGGLCTMAQIKGMLIGTSLSVKPYLVGKCIYLLILLILYTFTQLFI